MTKRRKAKHRQQGAAGGARWHRHAVPQEMTELLGNLDSGSAVAVVTLLGSLCPVTTGHVRAFVEARRLLLGDDDGGSGSGRPARLETFREMLGFVSVNPDSYVAAKFARRGEALPLTYEERLDLVRLAVADLGPWMGTEEWEGETCYALQQRFPDLKLVHFTMNGADDVFRCRKWRWAGPDHRLLTMGRPGDTERVVEAADEAGIDPAHFVMGPELPDISSTEARGALARGDREALGRLLHPRVAEWCLEHGSWRHGGM